MVLVWYSLRYDLISLSLLAVATGDGSLDTDSDTGTSQCENLFFLLSVVTETTDD